MQNVAETIIAQYANSPKLLALINSENSAIDPSSNIDDFYAKVWNIETAEGYGLDLWGRIIGVPRTLYIPPGLVFGNYDGFYEAGASSQNFGRGFFYTGGTVSANYSLPDASYRNLLYAKALSNITRTSIPGINQVLMKLFPGRGGNAYVIDYHNMNIRLYFDFVLQVVDVAILLQTNVMPIPTGVFYDIQDSTGTVF